MKKKYTKRQILESIWYWERYLNNINESYSDFPAKIGDRYINYSFSDPWLYVTKTNECFAEPTRKIGCCRTDGPSGESFYRKLMRYSTSVNIAWQPAYQLVFPAQTYHDKIFKIQKEFQRIVMSNGHKTGKDGAGPDLFAIDDSGIEKAIGELKNRYSDMLVYKYSDM